MAYFIHMGFFKKLFGIKETEPQLEAKQEVPIEEKQLEAVKVDNPQGKLLGECAGCGEDMFDYQKIRTIGGKKYHKRCFKDLTKLAHKELGI